MGIERLGEQVRVSEEGAPAACGFHTATALPDGSIVVIGGQDDRCCTRRVARLSRAFAGSADALIAGVEHAY